MNVEEYIADRLEELHREGRYRVFAEIERRAGSFPAAIRYTDSGTRDVTCSPSAPMAQI